MSENLIDRHMQRLASPIADDLKFALVRLQTWPDLSAVPEHKQVRVARICSLLSRKPTAGHLIPRVLDEADADVMDALLDLLRAGHISLTSAVGRAALLIEEPQQVAEPVASTRAAMAPRRSLIGKLWAKLRS